MRWWISQARGYPKASELKKLPPAEGSGPGRQEGGERELSGDGSREHKEPVRRVGGGARLFVVSSALPVFLAGAAG